MITKFLIALLFGTALGVCFASTAHASPLTQGCYADVEASDAQSVHDGGPTRVAYEGLTAGFIVESREVVPVTGIDFRGYRRFLEQKTEKPKAPPPQHSLYGLRN